MKAQVIVNEGRIHLEIDGEIIAANYGSSYPHLPVKFIEDGWLNGFAREVKVEYKTKKLRVGDNTYLDHRYLVTDDNGEVVVWNG